MGMGIGGRWWTGGGGLGVELRGRLGEGAMRRGGAEWGCGVWGLGRWSGQALCNVCGKILTVCGKILKQVW